MLKLLFWQFRSRKTRDCAWFVCFVQQNVWNLIKKFICDTHETNTKNKRQKTKQWHCEYMNGNTWWDVSLLELPCVSKMNFISRRNFDGFYYIASGIMTVATASIDLFLFGISFAASVHLIEARPSWGFNEMHLYVVRYYLSDAFTFKIYVNWLWHLLSTSHYYVFVRS